MGWTLASGLTIGSREINNEDHTHRGAMLTRVNELIDPATGQWDEQLVREIFWEEDAEHILSIPVHEGIDDIVAWHYNSNGIFSVKSAYKVYVDDMKRRGNTSS